MRIIAGAAGGRRLHAVRGDRTRPTADRTREALFSSLTALVGGGLAGTRVLDLYAGTGAVGLEALSRGAAAASLVEYDAAVLSVLRSNVEAVGLPGARVVADRVERVVAAAPAEPAYHLVFLDPPYALAAEGVEGVLTALVEHGWLAAEATVVVERARRDPPFTWPSGLLGQRERRYGEAVLWYGRAAVGP